MNKILKDYIKLLLLLTIFIFFINLLITGTTYSHNFKEAIAELFGVEAGYNREFWIKLVFWGKVKSVLFLLIYGIFTFCFFFGNGIAMYKKLEIQDNVIFRIHELIREIGTGQRGNVEKAYEEVEEEVRQLIQEKELAAKENEEYLHRYHQVMSYLAHDLRNPLTSISGYANYLSEKDESLSSQEKEKYLSIILEKTEVMRKYIDQLLNAAKFQEKNTSPRESVECMELLYQVQGMFYPEIQKKNLDFQIELEEQIFLKAYQEDLARAFQNILKNAIQYTKPGGKIRIRTSEKGNGIQIENDYLGMSDSDTERIFMPFYRIEEEGVFHGSGLGLSIAKDILEAHGFEIHAMSTGESLIIHVSF